jgi:hypothetical protein
VLAYAFQIYFDFSGYSDMAIGLALMLGFQFRRNSNLPYLSESLTEIMGSERLTGALLDRLTHRIHILCGSPAIRQANGESYRLRESKQRLKKTTSPKP